MKLQNLATKTKISLKKLQSLGLEQEATEMQYSENIKDFISQIQKDCELLLYPEIGFSNIVEHEMLTEEEIKQLFELYSSFCILLRKYKIAKLENKLLKWIILSNNILENSKPQLIKIYENLTKKWDNKVNEQLISEYLG